ncbi:LacI family DNA-binding transcriptional regulator [Pseudorhodoferax sp.]|uniref:LacI family DNA-binding transcriptional regulator n=1 Tax=Pseudorhodoferax sp. TaxID=1993553 RepID=UPI002DD674C3|nr:LacI family DNA-binding transcriptional regulator [Pseudorhodoferax sp.]
MSNGTERPAAPAPITTARASIRDIARYAGVSVATVSRVLNGSALVKPESAARVQRIMEEHHYLPHAAARSLGRMRSETIGVVLPDIHGEYFSGLMRGIDAVAREARLHVLVASAHGSLREAREVTQSLYGRIDGLLMMLPEAVDPNEAQAMTCGLPTVWMNGRHGALEGCHVSIDSLTPARKLTQHLIDGGRRRIAFISGPRRNMDADQRLRAYLSVLAEQPDAMEPLVLDGDFSEESGYQAGRQLCVQPQSVDAIFAANDMMALGCLFALQEAGVDVPGQVALVGFDDVPIARYVNPALTTAGVDVAGMGGKAMSRLIQLLGPEPGEATDDVFQPNLMIRTSSAAVNTGQGINAENKRRASDQR